jgi:hypothetical protein
MSVFKHFSRFMWNKNWIFPTIVFSNLCPMITITGRHRPSQCCCNLSMSFFLSNYTPKYLLHTSQPTATKYNIKYQSPAVETQALWYFMLQWKFQGASSVISTSFWILIGWFTDYLNVGCHVNNIMHHMFLLKGWLSFMHRRTHKMVAVCQYLQSATCTQSIMRKAITMSSMDAKG